MRSLVTVVYRLLLKNWWWVVRERQGLQYCTRATILHPATFKKRIGQYLQQEINITVQNEEISVIYHHMGLKNGLQSLEISDMKGRWRRKCPCALVRARLVAWWRAQIFGPRVDTGYANGCMVEQLGAFRLAVREPLSGRTPKFRS